MDINLDKNINEIIKDLKLRTTKPMKLAGFADCALLVAAYIAIIFFIYKGELWAAIVIFSGQTLWKISMALQDITRAMHVLCVFEMIKVTNKVDLKEKD